MFLYVSFVSTLTPFKACGRHWTKVTGQAVSPGNGRKVAGEVNWFGRSEGGRFGEIPGCHGCKRFASDFPVLWPFKTSFFSIQLAGRGQRIWVGSRGESEEPRANEGVTKRWCPLWIDWNMSKVLTDWQQKPLLRMNRGFAIILWLNLHYDIYIYMRKVKRYLINHRSYFQYCWPSESHLQPYRSTGVGKPWTLKASSSPKPFQAIYRLHSICAIHQCCPKFSEFPGSGRLCFRDEGCRTSAVFWIPFHMG